MAGVYRDILPLALGAAVSPVLLLFVVGVLSGSRPLTRGLVFGAGALSVSVVIAAVVLLGAEGTGVSDGEHRHSLAGALFDLIAGALLLVLAVVTIVRGPRPKKPPKHTHEPGTEPHLARTYLFGIGSMATNVTSLALYLPALKEIVVDGTSDGERALAAGVFIAIMLAPIELPLAAYAIAPARASAALETLKAAMTRHQRKVGMGVEVVFGAYLLYKGISHLP